MDLPFPSPTDPLLTPTTSESILTTAPAEKESAEQQTRNKQSVEGITSHNSHSQSTAILSDTRQQPPLVHHIQFRIGDASGTDNLDVLQDLLTSHNQSSPTILTPPNYGQSHNHPSERINSGSSISMSSVDSSEHVSHYKSTIPQMCEDEPKQVLVELYDLKLEDERLVSGCWEETARWIKYEEDVEGIDHRWGLPHVSFLSFHALLQLRKCIAKGIILLDMPDIVDFSGLTELVAAAIASESHEFGAQHIRRIAQILQLRHYHVGGRRMSRISTTASNLLHLLDRGTAAPVERERANTAGIPQRSVSAAPLAPGHPSAVNMRKILTTDSAPTNSRPHGRSFAHSPPTIAEVDECQQDSANNSIHKTSNFLQPRNSTPNVRLTFAASKSGGAITIRESSSAVSKPMTMVERKLTEWARPLRRKRDEEQLEAQRNQLIANPMMHKCSTDVNTASSAHLFSDLKKLPEGTELVQVLVGEVRWMKKARFVMLRLAKAVPFPELADSHFPIRIIFLILGPSLSDGSYHELGRSIATLMAQKHFKTIAYGARDRCQLIEGLDSFLDGSVVIPPGEIDSKRLISGDELKKALRRRKKEMNKQKVAASEKDLAERQQKTLPDYASIAVVDTEIQKSQLSPNGHQPPRERHGSMANSDRNSPSSKEGKKPPGFPLFRGLWTDITHRLPLYWSDIRDAANFQCLTSVVFMFFACFAPAISFGGLMGKYTEETMGSIETLFSQCICGILWGLFSAQPLLIMSATGPVLIFEASLYEFCKSMHLDFLTIRFYAGLFIFIISFCTSALDGARLLVYVTRFTEDIFATLISAIFIAESMHFLWATFKSNPVEDYNYYERIHLNCQRLNVSHQMNPPPQTTIIAPLPFDIEQISNVTRNFTADLENQHRLANALTQMKDPTAIHRMACGQAEPNTALLTAIIVFSTFILAFMLKKLRESFYLGKHLRRAIGDFGVLIAISVIALAVHLIIPDPYLQRLDIPDHINFTNPEKRSHGIIVRPKLGIYGWHGIVVALIAALLVFILLFVETEITEQLLTRKERGCKKGSGMHWDLVLMGACALLCSILGLPWMCAAAVQSLAHCSSLTVMKKTAPGARPEVDRVIEQRITTIGVSILIGLIAFAGRYLQIPVASLFGVFLYLGVMNLCGVQLVQRVILFFIPEKYFPDTSYTQEMSIWRMHLYTWTQLICLFIVYTVKYFKKTALAFPFVLMLFIFFRQIILPRIFTTAELKAIDGEEHSEEDSNWSEKEYYENVVAPISV